MKRPGCLTKFSEEKNNNGGLDKINRMNEREREREIYTSSQRSLNWIELELAATITVSWEGEESFYIEPTSENY